MLNYTICKVDIPFYSCQFSIDGPSLNGHNVTIHAECSKNVRAEGRDDYYFLELYMNADGYEDRDMYAVQPVLPTNLAIFCILNLGGL